MVEVAGWVAVAATVCAVALGRRWPFEIACHFRVQYAAVLAACALLEWHAGHHAVAATFAVVAAANVAVIAPLYVARPRRVPGVPFVRVMAANVLSTNLDYASLSAAVRRERPAVLVVQEVDAPWLAALEPLRAEWPHEISDARDDNFGIGLFSALPIRDARLIAFGPDELPAIVATIAVGERALTIVVLHAVPPRSHYHFVLRGMQLEGAAAVVRDAGPAILIGDFNTTPWSPTFTDLVADGRLLDGRRGFGLQPTWHTAVPPLLIPIDHCLHTPDVRVVSFRAGSPNGSDHYPLVVDVVPLR